MQRRAVVVVARVRRRALAKQPSHDVQMALGARPVHRGVRGEPKTRALAPRVQKRAVLREHRLQRRQVTRLRRRQPTTRLGARQRVHQTRRLEGLRGRSGRREGAGRRRRRGRGVRRDRDPGGRVPDRLRFLFDRSRRVRRALRALRRRPRGRVLPPHLLVPCLRPPDRRLRLRQPRTQRLALRLHRQTRQVRLHRLAALPQTGQRRALAPVPLAPLRRHAHAPLRVRQRVLVPPQPRVRGGPVRKQHVVRLVHADRHRELLHRLRELARRERRVTFAFRLGGHRGELRRLRSLVVAAVRLGVPGAAAGKRRRVRCGRVRLLTNGRSDVTPVFRGRGRRRRRRLRVGGEVRPGDPLPSRRSYQRRKRVEVLARRVDELALLRERARLHLGQVQNLATRLEVHRGGGGVYVVFVRNARAELRDARAQINHSREPRAVHLGAALSSTRGDRDVARGLVAPVPQRGVRAALHEQ
mmetsp:Transcript_4886/g.20765  ORF Transcript_4886/g.20765 Transcript_4886/m.20765 type:complete len:471 (-) Transcript_4886:311-1723(-)